MGTYYIPRNYRGESRILYIFTVKSLITTAVGAMLGFIFFAIFLQKSLFFYKNNKKLTKNMSKLHKNRNFFGIIFAKFFYEMIIRNFSSLYEIFLSIPYTKFFWTTRLYAILTRTWNFF